MESREWSAESLDKAREDKARESKARKCKPVKALLALLETNAVADLQFISFDNECLIICLSCENDNL